MKMSKISKSFKKDKADAVLVTSILVIMMIAMFVGIAIDVNKNLMVRDTRQTIVQDAVSASIRSVSTSGYLNDKSLITFVESFTNILSQSGDEYAWGSGDCKIEESIIGYNPAEKREVTELIEIQLIQERGSVGVAKFQVLSPNDSISTRHTGALTLSNGYKIIPDPRVYGVHRFESVGIEAKYSKAVSNSILGMVGVPCQKLTSEASAIVFGINADLANGNPYGN